MSSDTTVSPPMDNTDFIIGLILALFSAVLIGGSFVVKKYSLNKITEGSDSLVDTGFQYLKQPLWWVGLLTMLFGEILNLVAYTFAPAALVTPLGAVSVVVSAIMANFLLHEKMNVLGIFGCCICLISSTEIVVNAPKESDFSSVEDLSQAVQNTGFIVFGSLSIVSVIVLIILFYKLTKQQVVIPVAICSLCGAFTVVSCKGIGIAIKLSIENNSTSELQHYMFYVCLGALVVCCALQLHFLNTALATFNTAIVHNIYYVFFTSIVLIASSLLDSENENDLMGNEGTDFRHLPPDRLISILAGFLNTIFALFLLTGFKDLDISAKDLLIKWGLLSTPDNDNSVNDNEVNSTTYESNSNYVNLPEGQSFRSPHVPPPPKTHRVHSNTPLIVTSSENSSGYDRLNNSAIGESV